MGGEDWGGGGGVDGWDFNNRWNDFIRLFPLSCFKLIGEGDEGGGGGISGHTGT